ncbi:hypothetical protein [Marixanthomonas spongiae]|nr:hypothetical protein [Marixanthomonas spongiae]
MQPDSPAYIEMWFRSAPGYPLFVNAVQAVFGTYFMVALKVLQLCLGLTAVWFFIKQLRKHVAMQDFWFLLLTVILLIPYVYNQKVANFILSEGLAFPLYLLVTAHLLVFFFKERRKHLLYALAFLFVLLLTRKQFLFFVPIAIVMMVWLGYRAKNLKTLLPYGFAFLALPFLISLADSTYHKIVHGHFTNTPWNGVHLLAPAMYIADKDDGSIYASEEEKAYFNAIYAQIEQKKYNEKAAVSEGKNVISHYIANFPNIANHTIYPIGKERYEDTLSEKEALIKIDQTTTAMAFPLIRDNFKKWFSLYLKNFSYGFENSKYALLFVILLCFGIFNIHVPNTNSYKAIAFTAAITLANMAVVAIGMHTLKRFIFYNDWVLFFVVFLLLNGLNSRYFPEKNHHQK